MYSSGVQAELVTPTGAAIVKTLVRRFQAFPQMKIEKTGYGAGSRDSAQNPNVVRLVIGDSAEAMGKINAKLTSQQKDTWVKMLGEKFEIKFEQRRPGGGGGRRPGGARPGGGARPP